MVLAQAISNWTDTGQIEASTDIDGNPVQVPVMNPVYEGEWQYTDANGNGSVIAPATANQAEAEAVRDAWLAAGATP